MLSMVKSIKNRLSYLDFKEVYHNNLKGFFFFLRNSNSQNVWKNRELTSEKDKIVVEIKRSSGDEGERSRSSASSVPSARERSCETRSSDQRSVVKIIFKSEKNRRSEDRKSPSRRLRRGRTRERVKSPFRRICKNKFLHLKKHFLMRFLLFLFLIIPCAVFGQVNKDLLESQLVQDSLNVEFANPDTSVLLAVDYEGFEGLEFYPLDENYIIKAKFVRTPDEEPFEMPTTTDRRPVYVKYGEAHFTLKGEDFVLELYQSLDLAQKPEYANYLFLPFSDATNSFGSYSGGRYLDQRIPKGDEIILDFNRAYNPSCAYNPRYSCPLIPMQNDINLRIEAGVRDFVSKI